MTSGLDAVSVLHQAQGRSPEHVEQVLAAQATELGASEVALWLLDYGLSLLHPPGDSGLSPASVDGTTAGSCFATQQVLSEPELEGIRVWAPITERAQRLGVLSVHLDADHLDDSTSERIAALGMLAAPLVLCASEYCDRFERQRRDRPLELPAEMQWSLLPPLSFACDGLEVSGMLEPAYDVGGDFFDYALDGNTLSVAMFDAMGHGLTSAVLSALAAGAYRHGRRHGADLLELRSVIDTAIASQFEDMFVTALLMQLDVRTGRLHWHSAGHEAPLLVRSGQVLQAPDEQFDLPLGLGAALAVDSERLNEVQLEPGDQVLVYTDGVVEGRDAEGHTFGLPQLAELFLSEARAGFPCNEVLRRLVLAVHAWQGAPLRDDAALLMVRWDGPTD